MRFIRVMFAMFALCMLAACGGSAAKAPTTAPAANTSDPTPAANDSQSTSNTSTFANLPSSRTTEGYHVLGKPDAPLTIEFFSDFL